MRLRLFAVALVLGSLPFAARSYAGDPPPEPPASIRVLEHDLRVRLIPTEHRLIAEDRVLVDGGGAGGLVTFEIGRPLEWVGGPEFEGGKPAECAASQSHATIRVPAGRSTVVLRYRGVVYDAVEKAGGLTWVAGDGTKGLISEKGVYLAPSSRWIPTPKDAGLAKYHVTAWVPAPFHVVTQGSVPERTTVVSAGGPGAGEGVLPPEPPADPTGAHTTWNVLKTKAVLPTDGLTLVAGPYETKSRAVDGVTIGTFLYAVDAKDADLWLDATEAVVKRYAPILGPYPHAKFDIVENFFDSGFGMPSYTLLGDKVIQYVSMDAKRKGGKIPPGYVDHEYVHGWYGNGLFVDYAKGNWCEALTTYCSNYLAKELESVGEARAHRRGVLEKWAMRVKGDKDVPVRAFQEKTEDTDNDIGYGKGSMIFHLIRRQVGDEVFWKTLRTFTQQRVGTVVSWDDWFKAFDEASGISVTAHVKPYLDRPGLPSVEVKFHSLIDAGAGMWSVQLQVRHVPPADGGPPFPLFLPVRIEGVPREDAEHELDLSSGKDFLVGYPVAAKPRTVLIDPDYDTLRRIEEADLPPCLERTLTEGAGGKGVVMLAGGGEKTLKPLAEKIAADKGLKVVGPEFDIGSFAGPAVVLTVAKEPGRTLSVGGSTYEESAIAVLSSSAEGGRLRTTYVALSEEAAARASMVPFYGWDPWVVFRSGRPIARDPRNRERPSTVIVLDDAPSAATRRVSGDVDALCSLDFEGRLPGTEGHTAAGAWLCEGLGGLQGCFGEPAQGKPGDEPTRRFHPFAVEVPKLATWGRGMTLAAGKSMAVPHGVYRPFSFSAVGGFTVTSIDVVPWSDGSIRALYADAQKRGKLVAYSLTPQAAEALAPFLDYVDDLSSEAEAELKKPGRDGKPRARPPLATWISGRRARLANDLPRLPHPVIALAPGGEGVVETLAKGEGNVSASFEISFARPIEARLVGASVWSWDARTADRRRPTVLLMAHYDSFGKHDGKLWVGADDNATGVACLRAIVEALNPKRVFEGERAADVLVVFTDAEEWGLLGSRELVKVLAKTHDVRAVINVDSIGRAVTKPTHILGLSKHPALARLVRNALEHEGIVVGPDIDPYGYDHGSDHWPFHEAGIPAVTLWASDYGVMNTADDTPEKVEPEGVARIAAALARLLQNDLAGVVAAQDPPAKR